MATLMELTEGMPPQDTLPDAPEKLDLIPVQASRRAAFDNPTLAQVKDALKDELNSRPFFQSLQLIILERLKDALLRKSSGNVKLSVKGGNAYALLLRNLESQGLLSLEDGEGDLLETKGDWDNDIYIEDKTKDDINVVIEDVAPLFGTICQQVVAESPAFLDELRATAAAVSQQHNVNAKLDERPIGWVHYYPPSEGTDGRLTMKSWGTGTPVSIFKRPVTMDVDTIGYYLTFNHSIPTFYLIRMLANFSVRVWDPTTGEVFRKRVFGEMIDISTARPEDTDKYGEPHYPIPMIVNAPTPANPDNQVNILVTGYDDMFDDLMRMGWREEVQEKTPKRQKRFITLLRKVFCRPDFFKLGVPLQNPKVILDLIPMATADPSTQGGVCERGLHVLMLDENNTLEVSKIAPIADETVGQQFLATCSPALARTISSLIDLYDSKISPPLSAEQRAAIETPLAAIETPLAAETTLTADFCNFAKLWHTSRISWYANEHFQNIALMCIVQTLLATAQFPRIEGITFDDVAKFITDEIECKIRAMDNSHYKFLNTLNDTGLDAYLETITRVNAKCQELNTGLLQGTGLTALALVDGGLAFAVRASQYINSKPELIDAMNTYRLIPTADMDIAILIFSDSTESLPVPDEIYDAFYPIVNDIQASLQPRVPYTITVSPFPDDPFASRRSIHIGYTLPRLTMEPSGKGIIFGGVLPATEQHLVELHVGKQTIPNSQLDFMEIELFTGPTGELQFITIPTVDSQYLASERIAESTVLDPYKRKKYKLRAIALKPAAYGEDDSATFLAAFHDLVTPCAPVAEGGTKRVKKRHTYRNRNKRTHKKKRTTYRKKKHT